MPTTASNFSKITLSLAVSLIVAIVLFLTLTAAANTAQASCTERLTEDSTISGTWNADCTSVSLSPHDQGVRYARFYTFRLNYSSDVRIYLTSEEDTHLNVLSGHGADGEVLFSSDDISDTDSNSRLHRRLMGGDYTIEATTYYSESVGDFTLEVDFVDGTVDTIPFTPTVTATATATPTATVASTPEPDTPESTPEPVDTPIPPATAELCTLETLREYFSSDADKALVKEGLVADCKLLMSMKDRFTGYNENFNWNEVEWLYGCNGLSIGSVLHIYPDGTRDYEYRVMEINLGKTGYINTGRTVEYELEGTLEFDQDLVDAGGLAAAIHLRFDSNQLRGSIPTQFGDFKHLRHLELYGNQFSGGIPEELGDLSNLESLYLGNNRLTGTIPTVLGDLSQLEMLDLRYNRLTGSIPAELGDLSQLEVLDLSSNRLTGSIPTELGDLSNLFSLDLSQNKLTDSIPTELGDLSELLYLYLGDNRLTGAIPAELGDLSKLEKLDLGQNKLTGAIPAELAGLSRLKMLSINNNRFKRLRAHGTALLADVLDRSAVL